MASPLCLVIPQDPPRLLVEFSTEPPQFDVGSCPSLPGSAELRNNQPAKISLRTMNNWVHYTQQNCLVVYIWFIYGLYMEIYG